MMALYKKLHSHSHVKLCPYREDAIDGDDYILNVCWLSEKRKSVPARNFISLLGISVR